MEELMRVALLCGRIREDQLRTSLKIISERSGVQVEFVDAPDGKLLLACTAEFRSFEEGRSQVESVRSTIVAMIGGEFKIYVEIANSLTFTSLADYTVMLERRITVDQKVRAEEAHRRHLTHLHGM